MNEQAIKTGPLSDLTLGIPHDGASAGTYRKPRSANPIPRWSHGRYMLKDGRGEIVAELDILFTTWRRWRCIPYSDPGSGWTVRRLGSLVVAFKVVG